MSQSALQSEHLCFDTEALPPGERIARYRTLYGIGAEVVATGPSPRATFEAWKLDRAILYDRRLNDIGHLRSVSALDRYGMSHWTVTVVLEGWFAFDLGDGFRQIKPGEIQFGDVHTPARNDARNARIITVSIARDRLQEIVGPLDGLHGLTLDAADCRLYVEFVRSLLANLPTMKSQTLAAVTSAIGTLLKVSLATAGRRDGVVEMSQERARLAQVRALVDARLGDSHFNADIAVSECGLSRATVYRLLRPYDGLATFIQLRRLEYIRSRLSDPRERQSFAAIAADAGFPDDSRASRAFLACYKIRPGAYRATIADAEPDEQFRTWQRDLR